jgi:homogentisate 1,2-dioxygenase
VYDLAAFSPVSNSLFDHGDPSLYTVLSAPLDEKGSNNLDFVIFPPRWDPTEHTFRPPYYHRNATSEFNGVIRHLGGGPFVPGCYYLTPPLTPHGIRAESVNRVLRQPDAADRPARISDDSLWFQFETTLPVSLSSSCDQSDNRVEDWRAVWGGYRSR